MGTLQRLRLGFFALSAALIGGLAAGRSDAAAEGCDNGVAVGGTACQWQGDSVQYRCLPGSTPGASKWQAESCGGGHCQGAACTGGGGGGPPGCDNGVAIGGTACKTQGDSVQYRCLAGSTPGDSKWQAEPCTSGTCQGAKCSGGAGACGGQNKTCCPGRKCGAGLVCSVVNACVVPDNRACGMVGEPCCSDRPYPINCLEGVCIAGTCAQCGGENQRCCGKLGEPNLCQQGLQCRWDANKGQGCYPIPSCGMAGEPCCPGVTPPNNCLGENTCVRGTCEPCGATGQQCCPKLPTGCTDFADECRWNAQQGRRGCFRKDPCGELGQACCKGTGRDGCFGGTACRAQKCVSCGVAGAPCCWGGACDGGLVCAQAGGDNRCVAPKHAK